MRILINYDLVVIILIFLLGKDVLSIFKFCIVERNIGCCLELYVSIYL